MVRDKMLDEEAGEDCKGVCDKRVKRHPTWIYRTYMGSQRSAYLEDHM
jgi:hypothetical protein